MTKQSIGVWCALCVFAATTARAGGASALQHDLGLQVIPRPVRMEAGEGYFVIGPETTLAHDAAGDAAANLLQERIRAQAGITLRRVAGGSGGIVLAADPDAGPGEAYRLRVTPEQIQLTAAGPTGLFYAVQTLLQLLPMERIIGLPPDQIEWRVPAVSIDDAPRFPWRGLMLDCSRTFQSIDYLRKTLDRMACYKLNVLHLHLTDDQGWRMEIKALPELTQKGARFPDRWQEPEAHQGFYTQDELRELVPYAAARHITLVPEIEMPGHSLALLACHPELSCAGGPFEIHPFGKGPGIHADILCAGNDEVFRLLGKVLDEVVQVFPSSFVHIGGDEAPKERWKACPKCQARIRAEGLKDERELQSWFIKRIGRDLAARGRRLIGWDEILEGGLAPDAAVMSWRGMAGGVAAAKAGHAVVMSPTSHGYFDYPYARIDTRRAYAFEPVPGDLAAEEGARILGLQANFWSHIDREPAAVDRQLFPRLLAVAERGWSPKDTRDEADFLWRVKVHLARLDDLGVAYMREPARPWIPPVGAWSPAEMSEDYRPLAWDVTGQVDGSGRYVGTLRYTRGAHRLGIERAELVADGTVAASDVHRGETGVAHRDNTYTLELKEHRPGARYELRVSARSEGGTDSAGEVRFGKEAPR